MVGENLHQPALESQTDTPIHIREAVKEALDEGFTITPVHGVIELREHYPIIEKPKSYRSLPNQNCNYGASDIISIPFV